MEEKGEGIKTVEAEFKVGEKVKIGFKGVELEVDPAFPQEKIPRLVRTLGNFRCLNGQTEVKIWVFSEEHIPRANAYLKSKGWQGNFNLGSSVEPGVGVATTKQERDGSAEILVLFEETKGPEIANKNLGHELAHLLQGTTEGPVVRGEVGDLIRKPIGLKDEYFEYFRNSLKQKGTKPVRYVTHGLAKFLRTVNADGVWKEWLVGGDRINDFLADAAGNNLAGIEKADLIIAKLAETVGVGKLLEAYMSGDTSSLETIFNEKTGHSFWEFAERLDRAWDILQTIGFTELAQEQYRELYKQAIAMLEKPSS